MANEQEIIGQIREFNRFYTVLLGFLNRNYLGSEYSVTETRILFELKQNQSMSANRLIEILHLDKSYISRLIRHFEAQLRWFGVGPEIQGMGIGNKLLETAMHFCKERRYTDVILWTIDILKPARHLYSKYGFYRTETKPNNEWASYPLMEEKWEYHAS